MQRTMAPAGLKPPFHPTIPPSGRIETLRAVF
jgi:hypothetical protein